MHSVKSLGCVSNDLGELAMGGMTIVVQPHPPSPMFPPPAPKPVLQDYDYDCYYRYKLIPKFDMFSPT
jgi:hypothetical protein